MQAKDIYKLVSTRLQDLTTDRRWPWESPANDETPSFQDFLNNALVSLVMQRPDATSTTKLHTLQAGPVQVLTSDDLALLDCLYTVDGSNVPVSMVTRIDRGDMDTFSLGWMSSNGDIYHWAYERALSPRDFWVIPGATAGDKLMVVMSEKPTTISDPTDELNVPLLYQPALAEVMLYQVFASDTDDANYQKAMTCLETFAAIMGIKLDVDIKIPFKTKKSEAIA